jgi:hypothetical protein
MVSAATVTFVLTRGGSMPQHVVLIFAGGLCIIGMLLLA